MKWIVAIICLLVISFCSFGFMATFEPDIPNALGFRILYVVVGLAAAAGIAFTFLRGQER